MKPKWTDIWRRPFYNDGMGYIWGEGDVMLFTAEDDDSLWLRTFMEEMTQVLNGEDLVDKYQNLEVRDGCDLYWENHLIGSFRGWGHLTGGLGLDEKTAAEVQDEMIKYVIEKLTTSKWMNL